MGRYLCLEPVSWLLCVSMRPAWAVTSALASPIGFLYKVVHKIGRLRKFNRSCKIEFNFLTAWLKSGILLHEIWHSGQSVTASEFGSNGPRFESGRGRCVESLDKALYSHCPKEKHSH